MFARGQRREQESSAQSDAVNGKEMSLDRFATTARPRWIVSFFWRTWQTVRNLWQRRWIRDEPDDREWYFISTITIEGNYPVDVNPAIDAVFAESHCQAIQLAAMRNPLRTNEVFGAAWAYDRQARHAAIDLHDLRNAMITRFKEQME